MGEPDPSRKTAVLAVLAIVILVFGGIWLTRHMRAEGQMEDCLMAGRRTCAPT